MTFQVIEPESTRWDQFVQARGGHILQTSQWGALKSEFGWEAQIVALERGDEIIAGALMLFRRLALGALSLAYVPRGPVVDWEDTEAVDALMDALDNAARKQRAFMLKLEPDEADTPQIRRRISELGFSESAQTVQPPRTILIDISGETGGVQSSDDEALMAMSGSTRRKVRIAYRKDVRIRHGDEAALESFNRMMAVTSERNEFGVHSAAYYRRAYELFVPGHGTLLMASYGGQDIAGLFAFSYGERAWYFYGASSNRERNRMPTYALQWEAIRWAREQGCTIYDMWGIPDEEEKTLEDNFQDRYDGLWGVYGFKRGFGGNVVRTVGAWDRAYRPVLYSLYNAVINWREA